MWPVPGGEIGIGFFILGASKRRLRADQPLAETTGTNWPPIPDLFLTFLRDRRFGSAAPIFTSCDVSLTAAGWVYVQQDNCFTLRSGDVALSRDQSDAVTTFRIPPWISDFAGGGQPITLGNSSPHMSSASLRKRCFFGQPVLRLSRRVFWYR
jgi:hypothetical protein